MNRRLCLLGLLAGGSETVLASACSHPVPPALSSLTALGRLSRSDMIVRWQAPAAVPALADLPPGFSVGQELSPVLAPPAGPPGQGASSDPWGRLSAYSIAYRALPASQGAQSSAPFGDVICSVNAYVDQSTAHEAFTSWRAAVPSTYQVLAGPPTGAPKDAVVYVQGSSRACLVAFRHYNVLVSISVGLGRPAADTPPEDPEATEASIEGALELAAGLAALVARRIEAVAGR